MCGGDGGTFALSFDLISQIYFHIILFLVHSFLFNFEKLFVVAAAEICIYFTDDV